MYTGGPGSCSDSCFRSRNCNVVGVGLSLDSTNPLNCAITLHRLNSFVDSAAKSCNWAVRSIRRLILGKRHPLFALGVSLKTSFSEFFSSLFLCKCISYLLQKCMKSIWEYRRYNTGSDESKRLIIMRFVFGSCIRSGGSLHHGGHFKNSYKNALGHKEAHRETQDSYKGGDFEQTTNAFLWRFYHHHQLNTTAQFIQCPPTRSHFC